MLELEPQDLRQAQIGPSCLRLFLPLINVADISCTPPSRTHLMRYHESYFRDCYYHLPSLIWLCLSEVTAYDAPPSFPRLFAFSNNRFDSFIEESENLTRTDFPSCSRMDIEAFLYLSVFETKYIDSAENNFRVLLPLSMHSLPIPETRCSFWTSLLTLDEAASNRKLLIKEASKHKTCVEKGLVPIRCLKRMELPIIVLFKIAEAFEHRLLLCTADSFGYSEERHRWLMARNELYWSETLRGLDMSEAGVSSIRPDASLSESLAVKLLSLPALRGAREGMGEEKSREIRARAEMALADLALCKNHILKAVSLYEKVELPQAAWNHAQLLKHVALSGDPGILSVTQARPTTSHDLLLRSQKILSDWTEKDEVRKAGLLEKFQSELTSLDQSIHEHLYELEDSIPAPLRSRDSPRKSLNRDLNGDSPTPPLPFPSHPTGPQSTSSPKTQAVVNGDPLSDPTLSTEEKMQQMQLQRERMLLALKQREDMISNLTKKNVELKGIVQNLQFYFTDQKLLFKNPRDPEQATLRPEDLDNLPTPQLPTVHNLSGRNLSLSNSSPQYPFNNSASSNKSHTPVNSTQRSILEASHEEDYIESFSSPQLLANQSNAKNLSSYLDDSFEQHRPIISLKGKAQPQMSEQETASPFANLQLSGGTGKPGPFQINFQPPHSEVAPSVSNQPPMYDFSANVHPPFAPKQFSFKGLNQIPTGQPDVRTETEGNTSREDYVCTAEFQPLVQLPLVRLETGEESEEVLFCKRAKLFRFKEGGWVEKGVGEMKVLRRGDEQRCRLLMRRDKVMKLCCNHLILPSLELKSQASSDRTVTWATHADFSEVGEPEALTLAIRFKTAEIKEEFIAAVETCKQILKESTVKAITDKTQASPHTSTRKPESTPPRGPLVATAPPILGFGSPHPPHLDRQTTNTSDSDGDTDILSASSDNGHMVSTGPLKITEDNIYREQTLFKEQAMLTVNENKQIQNIGSIVITVLENSDTAQYRVVIQKENSNEIFSEHQISATFDLQPYVGKKMDKSWFWTDEIKEKKSKYIVRFFTSAISEKFSQVVQKCIERINSFLSDMFNNKQKPSSLFGVEAMPNFTFGNQPRFPKVSASSGGSSFEQSIPSPTIPGKSNRTIEEKANESNTSQTETSYEAEPYYEPVIVLPELTNLRTGEEEEEVMFCERAKIYRFANQEWKERGLGELKILSNPNTGKYRIIVRRDVVKKLCCNHYITSDMKLKTNPTSDKIWVWNTLADFSDGRPQAEQLAARFKTLAIVNQFRITFEKCQSYLNGEPKPKTEPENVSRPNERGKDNDSKQSEASNSETEDVVIVSVTHPTEDQVRRAREFLLPDGFYMFEEKPPCFGCCGCREDFRIEYQSEITADNTDTSHPLDTQTPSSHRQTQSKSGAIFGGNLGNLSFSSLLSTPSSGFQGNSGNSSFSKYAKPLFGSGQGGEADTSDYEPDNQYKPVVELTELEEIKTGEEEEEILFIKRGKLYRYENSQWKERGVGEMKILHNAEMGKYRVLMRRDQVKKICCNHFITCEMKLRLLHNNDKTHVWQTLADYSEETPHNEKLAIRFKTIEMAEDFRNCFEKCQEELMNQTLKPINLNSAEEKIGELSSKIPLVSSEEKNENRDSDDVIVIPPLGSEDVDQGTEVEKDVKDEGKESDEVTLVSPTDPTDNKQSSGERKDIKEEARESDDDIVFVSSAEPTPEQIAKAEEFMLPRHFYLYENKAPCPGCPGCDEEFEIVYANERAGVDSPTDGSNSHVIKEIRDASEDGESKGRGPLKGSFFGSKMEGGDSFTDLAKSDGAQGFKSGAGNPFKTFAKPLFAESDEEHSREFESDSSFKPIAQLPELQDLETGEEKEEVLASHLCTLLRYVDSEWKERGKGEIKILYNPDTEKFRVVMRRDVIKKVCCNHYITTGMKIAHHQGNEKRLAWRTNADFSEEPHRAETFVAAFRKLEGAKDFFETFSNCITKQNTT